MTDCLLSWIFNREKKISNVVSGAPLATVCGNEGFRVSALPRDMREGDTRARMRCACSTGVAPRRDPTCTGLACFANFLWPRQD